MSSTQLNRSRTQSSSLEDALPPAPPPPAWAEGCPVHLLDLLQSKPDCYLSFTTVAPSAAPGRGVGGARSTSPAGSGDPAPPALARVPMHSNFLQLHSPSLWAAFELQRDSHAQQLRLPAAQQPANALPTLPVMEAEELPGWLEVLYLLYHAKPVRIMDWASAAAVLPIAHKYGIACLLEDCEVWTARHCIDGLNVRKDSHKNLLRWMEMAERFQVKRLQAAALVSLSHLSDEEQTQLLQDEEGMGRLPVFLAARVKKTVADSIVRHRVHGLDPARKRSSTLTEHSDKGRHDGDIIVDEGEVDGNESD